MKQITLAILCVAIVGAGALAVTTSFWDLTSQSQFARGELHGVMISSRGAVLRGPGLDEHKAEGKAVWAMATDAAGKLYVGTGNKGVIYTLSGEGKFAKVHETGEMAVTCFARTDAGLYCGTIPGGKIFKIAADGKVTEHAKLDALYVWGLAAAEDGTLYAATGPDGKLFRVTADGKSELHFTAKDPNILSVVVTEKGELLCGSSENGYLYHVTAKGKARLLFDFAESEVRSIATDGDWIIIGANSRKSASGKAASGADAKAKTSAAETLLKSLAPEAKPSSGKGGANSSNLSGTVYRVDREGHMEVLFKTPGEFIWQVASLKAGIAVATGNAGRVHLIKPDKHLDYVLVDLAASQVMDMLVEGGKLVRVAAGNAAAVIDVKPEGGKEAYYLTETLDAQFIATWGKLSHGGEGVISFQTRSGQTAEPDETWSDWSGEVAATPFRVTSPRARYLQLRANLKSPNAVLRDMRVAYLIDNQRPVIASVSVGGGSAPAKAISKGPRPKMSSNPSSSSKSSKRGSRKQISWKAADADGDALSYFLYYKTETDKNWRPILPDNKPITSTRYGWDTSNIPDGHYIVRLVATDEKENPPDGANTVERITEPVLVDNSQPVVSGLAVNRKSITGRVRDAGSVISHLAFSVDGGTWKFIYPTDRLYDDKEETFKFSLNGQLKTGSHSVTVKATDAEGNTGLAGVSFQVE